MRSPTTGCALMIANSSSVRRSGFRRIVSMMESLPKSWSIAPRGGDHAGEAQLQQAQQLADHGRRAGLRGGELAVLVAQQQEATVVLEALGGQAQRLLHERLRVEALQGEVADAEQHLDAGLPAVQLLGEP